MTVWVDAQLSPRLASWLQESFEIEAVALRDLGLRDAEDSDIVQMGHSCGSLCGGSEVHMLEKVDGSWRKARVPGVSFCTRIS